MSPEAQRIAIAEVCGYRHGESKPFWMATPVGQPFVACSVDKLPDYLNDLNAMHEAESILTEIEQEIFCQELAVIVGIIEAEVENWSTTQDWKLLSATAAQRAEAFLRTLGKWVFDE